MLSSDVQERALWCVGWLLCRLFCKHTSRYMVPSVHRDSRAFALLGTFACSLFHRASPCFLPSLFQCRALRTVLVMSCVDRLLHPFKSCIILIASPCLNAHTTTTILYTQPYHDCLMSLSDWALLPHPAQPVHSARVFVLPPVVAGCCGAAACSYHSSSLCIALVESDS